VSCNKNEHSVDILWISTQHHLIDFVSHIFLRPLLTPSINSPSPDPINLIDLINYGLPGTPSPKQKRGLTEVAEQSKRELRTRVPPAKSISPKKSMVKMANMAFQGVDLTSEAGQVNSISWQ
jgi:hypothetical protein